MQSATYRQRSRIFLAKAWEELAAGDLEQASEKAWGAAATMVKAVAEERGLTHNNHRALYGIVSRLLDETGDSELGIFFRSASDLHTNFYENWIGRRYVADEIRDVERFLEKMEPLLSHST